MSTLVECALTTQSTATLGKALLLVIYRVREDVLPHVQQNTWRGLTHRTRSWFRRRKTFGIVGSSVPSVSV
jgi:hypothetical protein